MENQGRRSPPPPPPPPPPPVESPEPASGVPKKRPWSKPTLQTIGETLSGTYSGPTSTSAQ